MNLVLLLLKVRFTDFWAGKTHSQKLTIVNTNGRVAQRITRLTTDQKIADSNPAVLENTFFLSIFLVTCLQITDSYLVSVFQSNNVAKESSTTEILIHE